MGIRKRARIIFCEDVGIRERITEKINDDINLRHRKRSRIVSNGLFLESSFESIKFIKIFVLTQES